MKTIPFLFIIAGLVACNKAPEQSSVNADLLLADGVQSTLFMEKDTTWRGADLTNAANKFDRDKMVSAITTAVLSGKLKAYSNYPNGLLAVNDVKHILVQWDSTAQAEDPNNPGTFVSAPVKTEINGWSVPLIKFNEQLQLDTLDYTLRQQVSYITLYTYNYSEAYEIKGTKKLFDVKLNTPEPRLR